MKQPIVLFVLTIIVSGIIGCSEGISPVSLETNRLPLTTSIESKTSQTHLWGYWEVSINPESNTVELAENRQAMFTANVVKFINSAPAGLSFKINGIHTGTGYTDVDINVSITHPFPGMPQYNGYDVRGVFMGDGAASLQYNSALAYPVPGTDQIMLADPDDGHGAPDGYTRWFNKPEFSTGGMPLFSYTPGKLATSGFNGNATLNPYRYFADGLGVNEDLWVWLSDHSAQHGQFSSGATNTRNYYLRFPNTKGVKYGYAIIANWESVLPDKHPSNAPEAVACKVIDSSNVYYVDSSLNGGNLKLDISVWNWGSVISAGVMEDYKIIVESTVLSAPHEFTPQEMTPVGGDSNYSTFSVEIPADQVLSNKDNEYWVIVECADADYKNKFGVSNLAGDDALAAFFRYALFVADTVENNPPAINGISDDIPPTGLNTKVYSSNKAVNYLVDFTDPDAGQTHTIKWYIEDGTATSPSDPPDTMPFNWAPKTTGLYKIWVKVSDGFAEVNAGPYEVSKMIGKGWARTWGASDWYISEYPDRVVVDKNGFIYQTGSFAGSVDFDPSSSGEDIHVSNGYPSNFFQDAYISKFDSEGNFIWARTWGGSRDDKGQGIVIHSDGSIYVSGYFYGATATGPPVCVPVDFDPGPGEDWHTSKGYYDCFVAKYTSDGDFLWARTWGGPDWGTWPDNYNLGQDEGVGVGCDSSGNVYVGSRWYSQYVNFNTNQGGNYTLTNPGPGRPDVCISKFSPNGTWLWSRNWGAGGQDYLSDLYVDPAGNVYTVGSFSYTVDFDPGPGQHFLSATGDTEYSYISKMNSSGEFIWAKAWGNAGTGYFHSRAMVIGTDSNFSIWAAGHFRLGGSGVDFDPGPGTEFRTSKGGEDCYISMFTTDGSWQWVRTWGSTGDDRVLGGASDTDGNIYLSGYYTDQPIDLDPGIGEDIRPNLGQYDAWMLKLDIAGVYLWGRNYSSNFREWGRGVAVSGLDAVYQVGNYGNTIDFDPGPDVDNHPCTSNNQFYWDSYIVKFLPNGYW